MSTDSEKLRDLLLHRLPEAEADSLRERVLLDEDFAAALRDEEYALLDDHAAGRLTAAERAAVERHLLVTAQDRLRLRVAQALARRQAKSASRPRWFGWPMALVASLAVIGIVAGVWWGIVVPRRGVTPVVTVALLAEVSRGAGQAPLILTLPARGGVRIQAQVLDPAPGARYTLWVRDTAGHRLYRSRPLALRHTGGYAYVQAVVPAATLGTGARLVRVAGPGYAFQWSVQLRH
ncbi:MAG TPA: hypothetical protein VFX38_02580 [Gammaproteobacteria bacterium]|nr:hypothetical protein [Gammaproteobacteria bacterium]